MPVGGSCRGITPNSNYHRHILQPTNIGATNFTGEVYKNFRNTLYEGENTVRRVFYL